MPNHKTTMRNKSYIVLFLLSFLSVQCDNSLKIKKQLLSSELAEWEQQSAILTPELNSLIDKKSALERELQGLEGNLAQYKRGVKAYMRNHKMALAAIGGGIGGASLAMDADNKFSDEAQTVGGIITLFAVGWAWDNSAEITEVVDYLNQASRNVKEAEHYHKSLISSRENLNTQIVKKQHEVRRIRDSVLLKRKQLNGLFENE